MRLSRWVIAIPPLTERLEDIPVLVEAFAKRYTGRALRPNRELLSQLMGYAWPGNVRELDAVVERLCVTSGPQAQCLEAAPWLLEALRPAAPKATVVPPPAPAKPPRQRHERPDRDSLVDALKRTNGNVKRMAEELGIGRKTAYRWLEEAQIDVAEVRDTL